MNRIEQNRIEWMVRYNTKKNQKRLITEKECKKQYDCTVKKRKNKKHLKLKEVVGRDSKNVTQDIRIEISLWNEK